MKDLFRKIHEVVKQGQKVALATIVSSKGSLPMSKRAKMLVFQDGSIMGTIGGGILEADVIEEAKHVLLHGTSKIVKVELTSTQIEADGLTCGGTVEIFIEFFPSETDLSVVDEIIQTYSESRTAVVVTLLNTYTSQAADQTEVFAGCCHKVVIGDGGTLTGTFEDETIDAKIVELARPQLGQPGLKTTIFDLSQDQSRTLGIWPQTQLRFFLETILPAPTAYLFGGGHVSLALSKILHFIGFNYVVIDDRQEFLTRERFPEAKEFVHHAFENVFDELSLTSHSSYVIIVTRGHKSDLVVLEQAIRADVKYIGMIGSKRKIQLLLQHLQEQGIDQALLDTIHAPIGLEIEADTPEEIAISIAAELIKVRRSR